MSALISFVLARVPHPRSASTCRPDGRTLVDGVLDRPLAAPTPAPAAGCRPAAVALVPAISKDEPHAGSPDLIRWPISMAEAATARACIEGRDAFVELVEVCGSADRAVVVLERIRYEHRMTSIAQRAFGVEHAVLSASGHHALGTPSYPQWRAS